MKQEKRFRETHKQSMIIKNTICRQPKKLQIAILSLKKKLCSFQSVWAPIIQNTYDTFWNRWASPRRAAEVYARTVSNFADNAVMTAKIANNSVTANMEAFRTFIQREKEDAKAFSRIATNTAKTFENTSREFTPN